MIKSLSQLGTQLGAIWKQLGIHQRVTVLAAALMVVGGLIGLAIWSNRADYGLLYGRLDEGEAAKVVAVLDEAKVPYRIGQGGGSIYVPTDKVYSMRMQLATRGIPRGGEGVGFEIFDKQNFGLSDFVQRANYVRAVQGELARTIGQLDMVDAARVMIVMPENRLLTDSQRRPTASVFIRTRNQGRLEPQTVNSIRFLVANAVEGLQANHVTVVDNQGNVLSENSDTDSVAGLSATQLTIRQAMEKDLSRKAEEMLTKVLGPGQAIVRVAAELSFDTITRLEDKFDPEGQVIRTSTVDDETSDMTTASGGGVAGITTNLGSETNNASSNPLNNSRTKKKTTTSEYEINRVTSNVTMAPGGVKRLSAAVFVAAKMEGEGANRKVVPRSDDELKRLKNIVQSALGLQLAADGTRQDELNLEEMPFNDQFGVELTKQFDQQQKHEMWWGLAKNLIYPALALGVLFFFWRTFQQTPIESIPVGIPVGELGGNGNGNGHDWVPSRKNQPEPGIVTADVLNRLVRENPDNMTQAIRNWLTRSKNPTKPS